MPYHNLTKKELEVIKDLVDRKYRERVHFSHFDPDYTDFLGNILPKITEMIDNYDTEVSLSNYKCPHEHTYWAEQKFCDDCGSIVTYL